MTHRTNRSRSTRRGFFHIASKKASGLREAAIDPRPARLSSPSASWQKHWQASRGCGRRRTRVPPQGMGISGLPHDAEGFIPIDQHARVTEADGVYAAGDGTTFPIKQGGIAAQQADAAAEAIAAAFGAAAKPRPFKPIVRDMLLTGLEPIYLRADISGGAGDSFGVDTEPLWWPPAKIAGRHMGPYLASKSPG
jgi:hypothetical protein